MYVSYVRISHKTQNLGRQYELITKFEQENNLKVEKIFEEKASGKNVKDRKVFQECLKFLRENDTLIVESITRLGRNYIELGEIIADLDKRKIKLIILNMPLLNKQVEDNDLMGKAIRNILLEFMKVQSQEERETLLERQKQGIAIAKLNGKYKGRKPRYSKNSKGSDLLVYEKVCELLTVGISISEISRKAGITRQTIYRIRERMEYEVLSEEKC